MVVNPSDVLCKVLLSCHGLYVEYFLWVGDICQEQGVAWHRCACRAAVFLLDDFAELLDGQHATPHVKQGANNGANHVAEETIGRDGELPLDGGELFPACCDDVAVVGLHVGMEFGEGCEVDVVEQRLCRLVHFVKVKRLREAIGIRLKR